jgi:hypothetical protein
VRDFILPVATAVVVAFAWLALWTVCLRAFGIPVLKRSPEERAALKERILAMGKLRYVLIFGVLGNGLGFGLGLGVANMIGTPHFGRWIRAATQLVLSMILFGLWGGVSKWNRSFRGEVPFPPHSLSGGPVS